MFSKARGPLFRSRCPLSLSRGRPSGALASARVSDLSPAFLSWGSGEASSLAGSNLWHFSWCGRLESCYQSPLEGTERWGKVEAGPVRGEAGIEVPAAESPSPGLFPAEHDRSFE